MELNTYNTLLCNKSAVIELKGQLTYFVAKKDISQDFLKDIEKISLIHVNPEEKYRNWKGRMGNGAFYISINPNIPGWQHWVADFIRFENRNGRIPIAYSNNSLFNQLSKFENFLLDEKTIRATDPRWIVHSTDLKSYKKIIESGFLFSENHQVEIGLKERKGHTIELPKDYYDYIMFCGIDRYAEHVVASKYLQKVVTSDEVVYEPGGRFYFDLHQLVNDGIVERDGIHPVKVKTSLDLKEFLIFSISSEDFKRTGINWNTGDFQNKCNMKFRKFCKEYTTCIDNKS
jgi:hypothetical protein